jgi:hypothetical protein
LGRRGWGCATHRAAGIAGPAQSLAQGSAQGPGLRPLPPASYLALRGPMPRHWVEFTGNRYRPGGAQPALSKSMVEIGTDPPARHGGQKRRAAAGFLKSDRCASRNAKPTRNPNTRARAARLLRHLLLVRLLRRSHGSLPSCLNCGRVPNELRLPDASYDPINEMNAT